MGGELQQLLAEKKRDEAFAGLLKQYQNKVFHLVFSMIGNAARAEETTQDVFLKVWQALPRFDGRASLSTWIYTIAKNTTISHLRAEGHRRALPLEEAPEPFARQEPELCHLEVDRLVAKLPVEQRQAIELFYLQERSIQDVAEMLDLPEGTVKSHLHRARKALGALMGVKV